MAQVATKDRICKFRLSRADLASIKKLARSADVTVSDMLRTLIRRAKVAQGQVSQ